MDENERILEEGEGVVSWLSACSGVVRRNRVSSRLGTCLWAEAVQSTLDLLVGGSSSQRGIRPLGERQTA